MKILGVDPGVSGGLAVVEFNDGAAPRLVDAIDVPVAGVGAKQRIDAIGVRTWIEAHRPDHAAIERGQSMPRQGSSSGFKFGKACGALEAVIACCASAPMRGIASGSVLVLVPRKRSARSAADCCAAGSRARVAVCIGK